MPQPNPGEKKGDYIERCVKYVMEQEGEAQDRALAKCYGMWDQAQRQKTGEQKDGKDLKGGGGNSEIRAAKSGLNVGGEGAAKCMGKPLMFG